MEIEINSAARFGSPSAHDVVDVLGDAAIVRLRIVLVAVPNHAVEGVNAFPCDRGELCLKIIKLSLLKKLKTQRYTPKNTANHTHVYMSCMSCMYRHCRG